MQSDEFKQVCGETESSDAYLELLKIFDSLGEKRENSPLFDLGGSIYVFEKEKIWALPTMGHRRRNNKDEANSWMRHYWIAFGGLDRGKPIDDHFFEINPPWFNGSARSAGMFLRSANRLFLARSSELRSEWSKLDAIECTIDGKSRMVSFLAELSEQSNMISKLSILYRQRRELRIAAGRLK